KAGLVDDGTADVRTECPHEHGYGDLVSLDVIESGVQRARPRRNTRTDGESTPRALSAWTRPRIRRRRLIFRGDHLARLGDNQTERSNLLFFAPDLQLETILQHRLQHLLQPGRFAILKLLETVNRRAGRKGGLEFIKVGCCPFRLAGDYACLQNAG